MDIRGPLTVSIFARLSRSQLEELVVRSSQTNGLCDNKSMAY